MFQIAKKVRTYSFKGDYYHDQQVIAEYDKKTEETSYYQLNDILSQFDQAQISITIKDEEDVPTVEQPFE